jgi:urea transport system substrate-binding protein
MRGTKLLLIGSRRCLANMGGLFSLAVTFSFPVNAQDVIKVGILHSLSGPMAATETPLKDTMLFLIDEQNKKGGVLGKRLEAVVVDPASNWPLFAEKARELVTKEKVSAVFGCWTSVSRKSVLPVFKELKNILFYPAGYEGGESEHNVFYTGAAPNQLAIPAVDYLAKEEKVQRWVLAGTDYVYSHATNKILEDHLKKKGVGQEDIMINYTPFGHSDWRTIVADIKKFGSAGKRTTVVSTMNGDAKLPFYIELGNQGIAAKDISVAAFSVGEEDLVGIDTKPLIGHLAVQSYFQSIDTPANKEFIAKWKAFTKNPKRVTNDPMEAHAIGFALWVKAVEKVKTTDPDKVIDALPGMEVPNMTGGVAKMLPNHHITKPVFIGEIRADGQFAVLGKTAADDAQQALAPPIFNSGGFRASPPAKGAPLPFIQQTNPGAGGSGSVAAPAAADGGSSGSPPTYPAPQLGQGNRPGGGSGLVCEAPTSTRIPSSEEFFSATAPIPYCNDGFRDALLLDTASRESPLRGVCARVSASMPNGF